MAASQSKLIYKLFSTSSNFYYNIFVSSHGSTSRRLFSSSVFHHARGVDNSTGLTMTAGEDEEITSTAHPTTTYTPPNPIPNRPLRGGAPPPHSSRNINITNDNYKQPQGNRSRPYQSTEQNMSNDDKQPLQSSVLHFLNNSSSSSSHADDTKLSSSDVNFLDKFKLNQSNKNQIPTQEDDRNDNTQSKSQTPPSQTQKQDADEIFKKMKETGLIPNAVAMLDGLCKDGLVQDAMKLFSLMREKGTIPDVVIYTAVVEGFCKAHKPDDAMRIFNKMLSNGISPNAFSYSVLIQGLCNCNKLDKAILISSQMLQTGHSPNVTTFVALVDVLTREKGIEDARAAIETLKQGGFFLDENAVREYLDKKAPSLPLVWETIFGKKNSQSQKLF